MERTATLPTTPAAWSSLWNKTEDEYSLSLSTLEETRSVAYVARKYYCCSTFFPTLTELMRAAAHQGKDSLDSTVMPLTPSLPVFNDDIPKKVLKALGITLCASQNTEHKSIRTIGEFSSTKVHQRYTLSWDTNNRFLNALSHLPKGFNEAGLVKQSCKNENKDASDPFDFDVCIKMFRLANEYADDETKQICRFELCTRLDATTLFPVMELAQEVGDAQLVKECERFILTHTQDLEAVNDRLLDLVDKPDTAFQDLGSPYKIAVWCKLLEAAKANFEKARDSNDSTRSSLAFNRLCSETIFFGNAVGAQDPLYKQCKSLCGQWGRQHLEKCGSRHAERDEQAVENQQHDYRTFKTLLLSAREN